MVHGQRHKKLRQSSYCLQDMPSKVNGVGYRRTFIIPNILFSRLKQWSSLPSVNVGSCITLQSVDLANLWLNREQWRGTFNCRMALVHSPSRADTTKGELSPSSGNGAAAVNNSKPNYPWITLELSENPCKASTFFWKNWTIPKDCKLQL